MSIYYKTITILLLFIYNTDVYAQKDSSFMKRKQNDTGTMNLDAIYNRPFLVSSKFPVAVGGYMEINSHYENRQGITDGISFQMRRFTLFLSSTIHKRISFLSELEFEEGTKEINIEFAAVDFELLPILNFRTGIVLNPIGAFNQNHDGPKWEFTDRPLVATQLLPATWSTPGMGIFGKFFKWNTSFAYEAYLTNGFDNSIIDNEESKTFLPAAKVNETRFAESNSGNPLLTLKVGARKRKWGELGFSYMGGAYNKHLIDGIPVDKKRKLHVLAIDWNAVIKKNTEIKGELAKVFVEIPETYSPQYSNKQVGGFLDIIHTIAQKKMLGFEKAKLNTAIRLEYIDWNQNNFKGINQKIGDEIISLSGGLGFRPSGQTIIRVNYTYRWAKEFIPNPYIKMAIFQLGVSSYF